ncbi:MAG: carboxypeptidase-like regulatory domain-containing protein [Planctomycetota bacterium]|nr:carboxypeptidase regulatory-like domain-containing protein [Planctomycetaceae bacterium]MDQ3330468.1 carboxypeptidase-like regulatory domain-containing protein [Planctomycetota bacterium]
MSRFSILVATLTAITLAGCGGADYPETVPVEGTVFFDGKPVSGVNVSFFTDGAPRAAYGVTDSEGHFVLSTFGSRDGAIPGVHIATVSKPGEQAPQTPASNQPPKPEDLAKTYVQTMIIDKEKSTNVLPANYASKDTSPLKYTVVEDAPNNFAIELSK